MEIRDVLGHDAVMGGKCRRSVWAPMTDRPDKRLWKKAESDKCPQEHQQCGTVTRKRESSVLDAERFLHKASPLSLSSRWQPSNSHYRCKEFWNDSSREPCDPCWSQCTRRVCPCLCDLEAGREPIDWAWKECEWMLQGSCMGWGRWNTALTLGSSLLALEVTTVISPPMCPEFYCLKSFWHFCQHFSVLASRRNDLEEFL